MFDSLSTRIQDVFQSLRGEVRLSGEHVEAALHEIRLALLEADVNFRVVKAFVDRVRDKAMDQAVLKSLSPGQQVIKIVRDELLGLFGDAEGGLSKNAPTPRVVLLLGLQGSGKTTTSGKLGKWLTRQGRHPIMVSTDVRRPAAIQQLAMVGGQADVRVFETESMDPVARATGALAEARAKGFDTVIVDTAGRLHIDDELMDELQAIADAVRPSDLLYVADAMTGQDAIKSAGEFNRQVGVTGVVLTKIDGDARGGAALSMRAVTGAPIKFAGVGEKLDALDLFEPKRMAGRILGMGDIVSLVEKAAEEMDEAKAKKAAKKMAKGEFDMDDLADQFKQMRRMGGMGAILGLMPGMGKMKKMVDQAGGLDDKEIVHQEAIISSMTKQERKKPALMNAKRKIRVANGSGTSVQEVNKLLKAHRQMADMMKKLGQSSKRGGGMKGMAQQLGAMGGLGGGMGGGAPDKAMLLEQAKAAKGDGILPGADDLDFDAIEKALSGKGAMPPGLGGFPGKKK
jgi:signal recognition particle subunit SRP54